MTTLVADCPHCGTKRVSFLARSSNQVELGLSEVFCTCMNCDRSAIFHIAETYQIPFSQIIEKDSYIPTDAFEIEGLQPPIIPNSISTPASTPDHIGKIFEEGARCAAIGCHNAAAAMFRLVVDLTTKSLLVKADAEGNSPNRKQREALFDRLKWLFDTGRLSAELHDLADCIREDGNDGAHDGTIGSAEAADLSDFCVQLLTRIFTLPAQLESARLRRQERRAPS